MPEVLPLFKNSKLADSPTPKEIIQSEIDKAAGFVPQKINRKKRTTNLRTQQEKIKRLHEDYLISLVEWGMNIPKDKIELFKTLFLKHYKKQLIFEAAPDSDAQGDNSTPNQSMVFGKSSGKKYMDPDEFQKVSS